MNDNFSEVMRSYFKDRIPLFSSALLIILFCMPLDFFELSGLRPQVGLVCVYYWVEKRPNIFGYVSAFMLGLLMDICSTTPLGVNCVMMMIFAFCLNIVYRYIRPASFAVDWLFFGIGAVFYVVLKWLIFAAYYGQFLDILSVLPNIFSTIAFYPLIAYINDLIRVHLLVWERINE